MVLVLFLLFSLGSVEVCLAIDLFYSWRPFSPLQSLSVCQFHNTYLQISDFLNASIASHVQWVRNWLIISLCCSHSKYARQFSFLHIYFHAIFLWHGVQIIHEPLQTFLTNGTPPLCGQRTCHAIYWHTTNLDAIYESLLASLTKASP